MRIQQLKLLLAMAAAAGLAKGQKTISPPNTGENTVGEDYFLASYTQLLDCWRKVAEQSDRIKLEEIGKTAEDRSIIMAIITAPPEFQETRALQGDLTELWPRRRSYGPTGSSVALHRDLQAYQHANPLGRYYPGDQEKPEPARHWAIREGTAIVVTGDCFTVLGKWKVVIHDNTRTYQPWEKPYYVLSPGDVYNMKTRNIEKYGPGSPAPPPTIE